MALFLANNEGQGILSMDSFWRVGDVLIRCWGRKGL